MTDSRLMPGRRATTALTALAIGALAGIGFDLVFGLHEYVASCIIGAGVGFFVFGFERGLILPSFRERMRRLSTPLYLLVSPLVLTALIVVGRTTGILAVWSLGLAKMPMMSALKMSGEGLAYGVTVSLLTVAFFRVRDVVGHGTFINLLIGRYHRPIEEERIFLFVDLVGSTRFAEERGDLAAQDFLGRVFAAMAEPVGRARGAIADYVGDLVIVTWPLARGLAQARCVTCVFDIMETFEANGPEWTARYGVVPRFRAGLHCGPVVTAEVGVERHKIAFFGDVVNTTARLETLTRELGIPVLASSDLVDRLPGLPPGVETVPLGEHAIRGRNQALGVVGLRRCRPGEGVAVSRST